MPQRNALIVLNPTSRALRRAPLRAALDQLARRPDVHIIETDGPARAIDQCRHVASDYRKVIAVGGDGLLNEVLNAVICRGPALGSFPAGTGNDFTKNLPDYPAPLQALVDSERTAPCDAGLVHFADGSGRYFLTEAGVGLDVACIQSVWPALRAINGRLAYDIGTVRGLLRYRPFAARVHIDGQPLQLDRVLWIGVANTRYFGDGMILAPDARIDDGQLHFIGVADISKLELLRRFPMIRKGTHTQHPAVIYRPCQHVAIAPERNVPTAMDGEVVEKVPQTFQAAPAAFRVILPNQ